MSNFTENLKPATSTNNEAINELSPEEFQRTLLTWFENKGVIADLRAHLRRNMIDILRDTNLGQTVSQKQTTLSPKAQVINLLIIEFLIKHKYHFTLSVFSTEVPILNVLPEYSNSLINSNAPIQGASSADKPEINSNFTEANFWDILQTLGFSTESLYSKKLHDLYFNRHNDAFIICVIKLLATICNKNVLKNEFNNKIINQQMINTEMEPWIKDIYNLLTHFEIPDEVIIQLHDHLKSIFEKEQAKIKTEESTKFNFLHTQIQKDFQSREAEICKMINEMESTFYKEKQKLSGELIKEQEKLNQLTQALAGKQQECEENLLMLSRREESLKYRENEIAEQTEIIKSRIKIMQNIYDTIVEENSRIAQMKHQKNTDNEVNEQDKLEQTQLQLEYEYLRREIQETKETLKQIHKIIPENYQKEHQSECEEKLLRGLLERVQAENAQLRLLNTQQQIRIDELTVRNSVLMNDLENSQTTINVLTRSRLTNQITVPPLLAPPMPNTRARSPRLGNLNGGGENLGFVPQHPVQPTYRHLVHSPPPRDSRRKISRRIVSTESSDESSPSPTEEILREAKFRLRKLEEETESVDRSYRAFKQRQSQLIKDNMSFIQPPQYTASNFRSVFPPSNREFYKPFQNKERNIRNNRPEDLSRFNHIFNTPTDFQIPSTSKCTDFINVTVNPTENVELNQQMANITFVDENFPSTSRGLIKNNEKEIEMKTDNNIDYKSSGASSPGLPQFQNLSLSSIEMSTDNHDLSANKPAEKDL